MTSRTPPPGRPPRFETYRPSEERTGPPRGPGPQQPGFPPPHGQYPHPARQAPPQQPYPGQAYRPQSHPPMGAPPRFPAPPHRTPRPPAPRRRSGFGSMLLYGGLGLVALVAGAIAFAAMTLPADFVRSRAIAAVKEKTGRDLVITGPTSFTVYPALGISLNDVSLSGAPGTESAKPLVTMKSLDLSVAFWPLLERKVRVNALSLREPVFNLEVDASGRRSWDFAAGYSRTRVAQADAEQTLSDADPSSGRDARAAVSDLKLDDVRIDNGTLHYSDRRTGSTSEFSAINVRLALAALTEPLDAAGSVVWKGKTVSFDGALSSLGDVLEERPAKLKMKLGSDVLEATFEGSADLKDDLGVEGILSAKSQSARELFAWLGTDLPPSDGFGPLTAKGLWRGKPDQYIFTTAEIALDRTTALGEITLDTRGARPMVNANLKLTELDLNTYKSRGGAPGRSAAPQDDGGNAQSIEDLLQETAPPGPRVKGYTKRPGWSEEPFDLETLGVIDANAKLSIGKLTVGTMRLDQSDLTVALKNRFLTTTLDQVALYEGTGKGTITLDATAGTSAGLDADIALDGIAARPLLTDALEIDRLAGKGRLRLTLTGRGASQRQIVETLNGKADLAFADGAIIGINVPEMIRNLAKGNLGGLSTAPADKTDFSEMTSTWTIKSGIAENQDLKLSSPLLRLSGSGTVALAPRELDYTLRPKVVASLEGQGSAAGNLAGLEVPVRVQGSWEDPKFTPDVAGILNDPKTQDAVKEVTKQYKGKKADEIIGDLLSKDESGKRKGKKLLEQFLNGQ